MTVSFDNFKFKSLRRDINYIANTIATFTASQITLSSNIQSGDIILVWDSAIKQGDSVNIPDVIGTGFTEIDTNYCGTCYSYLATSGRGTVSYKIANGTESGTTISGLNGGPKVSVIIRPTFPVNSVTPKSLTSIVSETQNHTGTVTSSLSSGALLAYAFFSRENDLSFSLTPTEDYLITAGYGVSLTRKSYVYLKLFNFGSITSDFSNVQGRNGQLPMSFYGYLEIR